MFPNYMYYCPSGKRWAPLVLVLLYCASAPDWTPVTQSYLSKVLMKNTDLEQRRVQ